MVTYLLVQGMTTDYDRAKISYGIKVTRGRKCLRIIRDITDDKERLSHFIDEINELSLDPVHLDQILEEFLSQ